MSESAMPSMSPADTVNYRAGRSVSVVSYEEEENLWTWRRKIHSLFNPQDDHPNERWETACSFVGKFSFAVILISCISFCIESLPHFQVEGASGALVLSVIEIACVIIFTIELLVSFITCPSKKAFFLDVSNIVDLIAVLPFYIQQFLSAVLPNQSESELRSFVVFRALRMIRVVRVLKVSKYSDSLQLVWRTLEMSKDALLLLFFLVIINTLLFGAAVYYAEQTDCKFDPIDETWLRSTNTTYGACFNSPECFQSIPDAFWWAIVTMTTVGYGDDVPKTWLGRTVASLCMLTGIFVLSFPTMLIGANFSQARALHLQQRRRKCLRRSRQSDRQSLSSTFTLSMSMDMSTAPTEGNHSMSLDPSQQDRNSFQWTSRRKLYSLLDLDYPKPKPENVYEIVSRIIGLMLFLLVLGSITCHCISTLPSIHAQRVRGESGVATFLEVFEVVSNVIFTIDIVARLVLCDSQKAFVKDLYNWFDIVSVLPFYLEILIRFVTPGKSNEVAVLYVLRILRLTRLAKCLKLHKYGILPGVSKALVGITQAFTGSLDALSILFGLVLIALVIFGTAMFLVEQQDSTFNEETMKWYRNSDDELIPSPFQSIPGSFWWAIVTMTTVGYGDATPSTYLGQIVGVACMMAGILVLVFPVIIIGTAFDEYREKQWNKTSHDSFDSHGSPRGSLGFPRGSWRHTPDYVINDPVKNLLDVLDSYRPPHPPVTAMRFGTVIPRKRLSQAHKMDTDTADHYESLATEIWDYCVDQRISIFKLCGILLKMASGKQKPKRSEGDHQRGFTAQSPTQKPSLETETIDRTSFGGHAVSFGDSIISLSLDQLSPNAQWKDLIGGKFGPDQFNKLQSTSPIRSPHKLEAKKKTLPYLKDPLQSPQQDCRLSTTSEKHNGANRSVPLAPLSDIPMEYDDNSVPSPPQDFVIDCPTYDFEMTVIADNRVPETPTKNGIEMKELAGIKSISESKRPSITYQSSSSSGSSQTIYGATPAYPNTARKASLSVSEAIDKAEPPQIQLTRPSSQTWPKDLNSGGGDDGNHQPGPASIGSSILRPMGYTDPPLPPAHRPASRSLTESRSQSLRLLPVYPRYIPRARAETPEPRARAKTDSVSPARSCGSSVTSTSKTHDDQRSRSKPRSSRSMPTSGPRYKGKVIAGRFGPIRTISDRITDKDMDKSKEKSKPKKSRSASQG